MVVPNTIWITGQHAAPRAESINTPSRHSQRHWGATDRYFARQLAQMKAEEAFALTALAEAAAVAAA